MTDEQEHRRADVIKLRGEGLSERDIAERLGISQPTVHRILASSESPEQPERITGRDGRSRPAKRATATADGAAEDTEPVTSTELRQAALSAVEGYAAVDAALGAVQPEASHSGPPLVLRCRAPSSSPTRCSVATSCPQWASWAPRPRASPPLGRMRLKSLLH